MVLAFALASTVYATQSTLLESTDRDLSYQYIEASYVRSDFDDFDDTLDGFAVGGSIDFGQSFFLRLGSQFLSGDLAGFDTDTTGLEALLGYHHELEHGLDLIALAGAGWAEVDVDGAPGGAVDDTGFLASGGVRFRPNYTWEFEGTLDYANFDSDGTFGGTGTVRAHISNNAALFASYSISEDVDTLALGVRFAL